MNCANGQLGTEDAGRLARLEAENALLRQTLTRCSQALTLRHPGFDDCQKELHQVLRSEDRAVRLDEALPRLEATLTEAETQRSAHLQAQRAALIGQAAKLQALPLSPDLQRAVQQFIQSLHADTQPLDLTGALSQFNQFQWQALAQHIAPRQAPGLLQRLLGAPAKPAEPAPDAGASPSLASRGEPLQAQEAIGERIEAILRALIEDDDLPPSFRARAQQLFIQTRQGLHGDELVAAVQHLAHLVREAGREQLGLTDYLRRLIARLTSFQVSLEDVDAVQSQDRELACHLDQQLREHVTGLQYSVREAVDLDELKCTLNQRLETLLESLTRQQLQRQSRDQALQTRLRELSERVAGLELEAQSYRTHIDQQQQQALLDPLTGLPNRSAWNARLREATEQWQAQGGDLLLAVLDVDHFKQVNDSYGHLAGDKVLKLIADALVRELGSEAFMARFGGEEFVLLLPGRSMESGRRLLNHLLASIEGCPFHFKGARLPITLSAGLTAFAPGETGEQVFQRADQALYRAKHKGRNRLELDDGMPADLVH